MPSKFSQYTGGIQPIPNAYEMMSRPSQILAQGAVAATKDVMAGFQQRWKSEEEQAILDKKLAAQKAISDKEAADKRLETYLKFKTDQNDRAGKALDTKVQVLSTTNQNLLATLQTLDPEKDAPERERLKKQIQANNDLIQSYSAQRDKNIDESGRLIDDAYLRGIQGTSQPGQGQQGQQGQQGNNAPTTSGEQQVADFSIRNRNVSQYGASDFSNVTQVGTIGGMPTIKVNDKGQNYLSQPGVGLEGGGLGVPTAGTQTFRQPVAEQNTPFSGLLRPVGTGITDLATKYPYGNVVEDTAPVPNSVGRIVKGEDGRYAVAVSPIYNQNADEGNVSSLAGIVGGINKTRTEERLDLVKMLTPEAKAAAKQQYDDLKEAGAIPNSVTFTDFMAGRAVEAFEMGDDSAFQGLTPEARAKLATIANPTRGPMINEAPKIQDMAPSGASSSIQYDPVRSATTPLTGSMYDTELPPPPRSTANDFIRSGGSATDPYTGQVSPAFKMLQALDAARNREWQHTAESLRFERENKRLEIQRLAAEAAVGTREDQKGKLMEDQVRFVQENNGLFPGLGTTIGPPSILGAVKELDKLSPGISADFRASLMEGVPAGRNPRTSDYHRAWIDIGARIPYSPDQAKAELKSFTESVNAFRTGWDNTTPLLAEFEAQSREPNALNLLARRMLSPEAATAANYRLFLLGAFRKATTGGGNPSNFEQELLLNLIADPKGIFQITDNSLARTRSLLLVTTNNMLRDMQGNNFKVGSETLKELTNRFRAAKLIGDKDEVTVPMLENFRQIMGSTNTNPASQMKSLRLWAMGYDSSGKAIPGMKPLSQDVIQSFATLEKKVENGQWIGANSAEASTAKQGLTEYLCGPKISQTEAARNLSELDPIYRR